MVVSTAPQTGIAAPDSTQGWRVARRAVRRAPRSSRRRHARPTLRHATWVPAQTAPRMTVAQACRLFADDRRLVRVKLLLLAGLVIATAALERVV
jgi:hypothetical protein